MFSAPGLQILRHVAGDLLDGFRAGVDAQIIVRLVAPLPIGAVLVVAGAVPVHLLDVLAQLLVALMLVRVALLTAAQHFVFHVRIDEDAEGLEFPEKPVGAAPDDHAVRVLR